MGCVSPSPRFLGTAATGAGTCLPLLMVGLGFVGGAEKEAFGDNRMGLSRSEKG